MKTFLLILLFPFHIFSQQDDLPLAKVGNITITKKEFVSRYELLPGINRRPNDVEANKAEFLLSLIAEKLLINKGEAEGWENDTVLNDAVQEIERLLVRDELYRREISQKVSISEKEIAEGLRRSLNDMKVYFLFAKSKKNADDLYAQIVKGKPLETFSFPEGSEEEFGGPDSAIARFGDVDERMEQVIYNLSLNGTSKPILLDDGWYIVKLMGKTVTVLAGEKERKGAREKVESILRKRKEQLRMTEYMNKELRSIKTDINGRLFKLTIIHLWEIVQKRHPIVSDSTMFLFDRSVVESLRMRMGDSLNLPFVTFPHGVWTLEKTLYKFSESNLATPNPTLLKIRQDMVQRLRDIIDQEYLVRIGYRQSLQLTSAVRNDVRLWRESYLSDRIRQRISDTVSVSQNEIEELRRIFRNDSLIVRDNDVAREKMKQLKVNETLNKVIGSVANGTEITFYEKNFSSVKVSNTSAMVFRYLGFGGRMFAVPFVAPQIGWINYWNNKDVKLP